MSKSFADSLVEVPGSRVVDSDGRLIEVSFATPESIAARAAMTPEDRAELEALERGMNAAVLGWLAGAPKAGCRG